VETQIVVVPGVNDGRRLESTVSDLFTVSGVRSVGVVPVGLTDHRKGLAPLRRPDAQEAADIIYICNNWRTRATGEGRGGWIYPSDELFLLAGRELPPSPYYSGCTLRENGIGMLAELESLAGRNFTGQGILCTGSMAAPFLRRIFAGSGYSVAEVENRFLGSMVGAAGLLAGEDAARTVMESRRGYNRVILPSVMFNHDMLTIDDLSPRDISRLTGREVKVAQSLTELE
jgi:NifB/MoaA-like Fe-S oxidoreductase